MNQNYKNIFIYNKKNELTTYVDLDENNKVVNYYNLLNRELTKINICEYNEKNKTHIDIKKAKILFSEDCVLHHMFLDGDSRVVANKSNSNGRLISPKVVSRVYSYNDNDMDGTTIQNSLVQDWLKKL